MMGVELEEKDARSAFAMGILMESVSYGEYAVRCGCLGAEPMTEEAYRFFKDLFAGEVSF